MLRKIESNAYADKPNEISKDIEKTVDQYKKRAKGENKGDILSEFLANMNPIIMEIQKPKVEKENMDATRNIEKQELDQKYKLMEQKMKSLENQLLSAKEENSKLASKVTEIKKQDPKQQKPKPKTGCCGG